MFEKTKTLEEIRLFVCLVLICGFYIIARAHNFSENQTNNDLESIEFDSIFFLKNLDSADNVEPEFVYDDNYNRRYIVVKPNADSYFWQIDSIISDINYDSILSYLSKSVVDRIKVKPRWYLDEIVYRYKYFEVTKLEGGKFLDFNLPLLVRLNHDYAIKIYAYVRMLTDDYDSCRWNFVWEKADKVYLFSKLYEDEFDATSEIVKLHNRNRHLGAESLPTVWTFPIRDGKIVGAFMTFYFGDACLKPTIDLFNNTYVYPQYYLKKEAYEKLPYWIDPRERARQLKERCSFIAAALLPAFPCCLLPAAAIPLLRIDLGHCVSGQDCQALAEQRVPEGKIFASVEQMPQFPGGEAELLKYVSDHLVYPEEAKKKGIKGRVVIQFVVLADGSIGEVKVAWSKNAELDKAAVEVVKNLPKFKPGLLNDRPVAVWYTLPVIFKLPQE